MKNYKMVYILNITQDESINYATFEKEENQSCDFLSSLKQLQYQHNKNATLC